MKLGVAVTTSVTPATESVAQADYVRRLALAVESAGYDSVWVSDRTVFPSDLADRYPEMYGPGRSNPDAQNVLEAMTALSYVGGMTSRVRLGLSVLVLPFRHPLLNAKMATTLDVLSGGRLIFGVGTGWMQEEFDAMGATMAHRGRVTDDHLRLFKAACLDDEPDYRGDHASISGMRFFPTPVQRPHPPIWIGGNSDAALLRSARLGDAWHGINLTPKQVAERRERLRAVCEREGREAESVQVTLRATLRLGAPIDGDSGSRVPLSGSMGQVREDLDAYEHAGLEYMVLSVAADSTDSTIEQVNRLADVMYATG